MEGKRFLNWSGGKDSALAFYEAKNSGITVGALVTCINSNTGGVAMHGVPKELIGMQAAAIGLPLHTVDLPEMPAMEVYEAAMRQAHKQLKLEGFTHAMFGDIFLEDLKLYRENLLRKDGLPCLFPLWQMTSSDVMKKFIDAGFKAIVVCVNAAVLDKSFCGRLLDESFMNDLPDGIDVCGENGEYHSFVFDGPIFSSPVDFITTGIVYKEFATPRNVATEQLPAEERTGFYYLNLLAG